MTRNTKRSSHDNKYKCRQNRYNIIVHLIEAQNRTSTKCASHTAISKQNVFKKWSKSIWMQSLIRSKFIMNKFCLEKMKKNSKVFMQNVTTNVFKTFLLWTLNAYQNVKARFTFNIYWRILKMIIFDEIDRKMKKKLTRDVNNVRSMLQTFRRSSNWRVRFV